MIKVCIDDWCLHVTEGGGDRVRTTPPAPGAMGRGLASMQSLLQS